MLWQLYEPVPQVSNEVSIEWSIGVIGLLQMTFTSYQS